MLMARRHVRVPWPLAVPAVAAAVIALIPLVYLVVEAFSRGAANVWDEIFQARTWDLVRNSFLLTAVVTAASVVLGTGGAWVTTRFALPGKTLILVLLTLPLAIPSYLSAFAWISWQPQLAGFWGAAIVLTFACFPYVLLPVAAALRGLDPAQEEVARSLGKTPQQIASELVLRQVRPSITAGALLVALYVLSDFGAVAAMRYETFTWVIYGAYRAGFNPSRAAILSMVLVSAAAVLVILESRARGRAGASRLGSGVARVDRRTTRVGAKIAALGGVAAVLGVGLGVPVASVISWMGRDTQRDVQWSEVMTAVGDSFIVGLLTAIATVLIALPVGIAAARYASRFSSVVERTTYVSHALPGIVIAISVVFVGIRLLRPWYQELPLLVLGQVVIFLPLAVAAIRNSIEQSSPRMEEVAHSLGAGTMATILRVTIPLALPGIGAAAAMTLLNAMKELPTTLLLRPTGWETLATSIWKYSTVSDYAAVGPYALALMLLAALPTAVLSGLTLLRSQPRPHHSPVTTEAPLS
jgi:iron(III) transport system permease protein